MSVLLKELRGVDFGAADILEQAKLCSDSEIRTLTREELLELFPGPQNLKRRRTIFETIHKQKPVELLLKELQDFIPRENFRAAPTSQGIWFDYLHILKDMRTQLNNVQSFLDAHVSFLENVSKDGSAQQGQGSFGGGHSDMQKPNISGAPSSGSSADGWETLDGTNYNYGQNEASSEKPQTSQSTGSTFLSMLGFNRTEQPTGKDLSHADKSQHKLQVTQRTGRCHEGSRIDTNPRRRQVNYKMVVTGKTFDAHLQILVRIQGITQQLHLVNMDNLPSGVCHVTFVFCPVVSRVGTDVEAAMKKVEGSGPVILVLMHHSHEAKHIPSIKTEDNVFVSVNVFYHEKLNGLISCRENEAAVSVIRNELLNRFGK